MLLPRELDALRVTMCLRLTMMTLLVSRLVLLRHRAARSIAAFLVIRLATILYRFSCECGLRLAAGLLRNRTSGPVTRSVVRLRC